MSELTEHIWIDWKYTYAFMLFDWAPIIGVMWICSLLNTCSLTKAACCRVHILFCLHSICWVLPARGNYRFVWKSFRSGTTFFMNHNLSEFCLIHLFFISEMLWSGIENFVFDWLINADRWGPSYNTVILYIYIFDGLIFTIDMLYKR